MKTTATLALLAIALAAQAESAKLVAKLGNQEVGTVLYKTEIAADHSWTETFSSKLEIAGHRFEDVSTVHFSPEGKTQEDDEMETIDGEIKRNDVIKFQGKTAVVTDKLADESKTYTAPDDPPTLDPSDSWFVTTKPKIGDKAVASSFSKEEGWHRTTVTYVEDRAYKVGDQTIPGHLLRHDHPKDSYEEILDDHGLPLEVDLPASENGPAMKFIRSPYTDV